MKPSDLLKLNDVEFLKAIVKRYPETELLAGAAEASPEGNQTLKEGALAYKAFEGKFLDSTAIEADRTFLGLLTLKAAMTGDKSKFPNLSDDKFAELENFTKSVITSEEDIEFALYSLAANDLGKTQALVNMHQDLTGHAAEDHDQLLGEVMQRVPERFAGYNRLTDEQKQAYVDGLNANLNLGQYVQGENLPVNLEGMQAISEKSRDMRLIAELYDFAGIRGHINPNISLAMNNDTFVAYSTAIEELMIEPREQAYERYISKRGEKVGITTDTPEGYAKGRVATMSGAFGEKAGRQIEKVWKRLPQPTRDILTAELNETGKGDRKGVLVYYSPAVIANAIKATGDFEQGLEYGLKAIAGVYKDTRRTERGQGEGVITVNVADLAKQASKDPESIAKDSNHLG